MTEPTPEAERVLALLDRVTGALPGGGEARAGQREMAGAIADAITRGRHLAVQAGTGTGKSLAYLVAAAALGRRTVVATATKALQDQLADRDLPFLVSALAPHLHLDFAVLKGRSNYLCLQRLDEHRTGGTQLGLGDLDATAAEKSRVDEAVARIAEWADETTTGDRAELPFEPTPAAWAAVSVGPRECPGRTKCPRGEECFTELARDAAAAADVVVVNTHLYGVHLSTGGAILPDHQVVVFDEAHQAEDTFSDIFGVEISGGRFLHAARALGGLVADTELTRALTTAGELLGDALEPEDGRRLGDLPTELADALTLCRGRLETALDVTRGIDVKGNATAVTAKARALNTLDALATDVDRCISPSADQVRFVTRDGRVFRLRVAPLDVAEVLTSRLWATHQENNDTGADPGAGVDGPPVETFSITLGDTPEEMSPPGTVILTSATLPEGLPTRLGAPPGLTDLLDVGSPFDYEHQALLYCAAHLPDPRGADYRTKLHHELDLLIRAARGRTLALFTSYRAMTEAHESLAASLPFRVLLQGELPKPALVRAFSTDESSCLFATMGYWQGIDVPGRTLSLVTIDRLPFPRPDDPLLGARRDAAGAAAFRTIDVPRAATMLAQGAGRLIRNRTDRGVVAVLDRRLATSASYRWDLIRALPPMKRTKDRAEALAFLRALDPPATS